MKYNDKAFLDPAFAVVKQTDPDTYARMVASKWNVTVNPDFNTVLDHLGLGGAFMYIQDVGDGVTAGDDTYIDKKAIAKDSREFKTPVPEFVAGVLVHEFQHTQQPKSMKPLEGERGAFTAQIAFMSKLGCTQVVKRLQTILDTDVKSGHYMDEEKRVKTLASWLLAAVLQKRLHHDSQDAVFTWAQPQITAEERES